jgi:hypothetical protein
MHFIGCSGESIARQDDRQPGQEIAATVVRKFRNQLANSLQPEDSPEKPIAGFRLWWSR